MTIEQCYEKLGGDFSRVCRRLPGRGFVERFVQRYLEDDSARMLLAALQSRDLEEAFRYAMALKGVAGNLGFENLERAAAQLAEALRCTDGGMTPRISALAEVVRQRQQETVAVLRLYLSER